MDQERKLHVNSIHLDSGQSPELSLMVLMKKKHMLNMHGTVADRTFEIQLAFDASCLLYFFV
jgi:hypothetical protein